MTKEQEAIAEKILNTLESQRFSNWYGDGGKFDLFIRGEFVRTDPRYSSREVILGDIERLFNL